VDGEADRGESHSEQFIRKLLRWLRSAVHSTAVACRLAFPILNYRSEFRAFVGKSRRCVRSRVHSYTRRSAPCATLSKYSEQAPSIIREGEETTPACRFVGTRSEVAVDPATNRPERRAKLAEGSLTPSILIIKKLWYFLLTPFLIFGFYSAARKGKTFQPFLYGSELHLLGGDAPDFSAGNDIGFQADNASKQSSLIY
jgi:hypothetical protein